MLKNFPLENDSSTLWVSECAFEYGIKSSFSFHSETTRKFSICSDKEIISRDYTLFLWSIFFASDSYADRTVFQIIEFQSIPWCWISFFFAFFSKLPPYCVERTTMLAPENSLLALLVTIMQCKVKDAFFACFRTAYLFSLVILDLHRAVFELWPGVKHYFLNNGTVFL